MLETKYTCDVCGLAIDGKTTPEEGMFHQLGGGLLCVLKWEGSLGHNGFVGDKHYHGVCFGRVVDAINAVK